MDVKTQEYYVELSFRQAKLRWSCLPQWKADHYVLHGRISDEKCNYTELAYGSNALTRVYGEWYRCLAYMRFGYGNLSNNDRTRRGLKTIRKRRKGAKL
jgi:hypothetical protein